MVIPVLDLAVLFTAGNYSTMAGVWWMLRSQILVGEIIPATK